MINYGKHYIDKDDIEAVTETLKSDYLTGGEKVENFKKAIENYSSYDHCSLVNSGTSALNCACYAINLKPDDEVIIPAISFVATANCVMSFGAIPVFADVNKETLLIDIENIKKLITKKTKAVISMDYAGQTCNYKKIKQICRDNKLFYISDSAHSFGTINKLFENDIPDIVCYSFHPVKTITTGEGGAMCTNELLYYYRAENFKNNGRNGTYDSVSKGSNYKMSDINASLGLSQLNKIDNFLKRRCQIAKKYDKLLKCEKLLKLDNSLHVYHLYVIKVKNRTKFIAYMRNNGVNCVIHYMPIYTNTSYSHYFDTSKKNCTNAEKIKNEIVSIPMYFSLTDNEQDYIIRKINKFVESEEFKN